MSDQKKLPEVGPRKARFNRYIIAGRHTVAGYQGAPDEEKPLITLGWELSEDFTDEETPRPMWIKSWPIADFNGEKAKKTRWFTNMFFDYDPGKSNPEDFLGRPCRVIVEHRSPKSGANVGKFYANIKDLRDYDGDLPELSQPAVFFDFYNPTQEGLEKLFPWEIDYLKEANDYPGSKLEAMLSSEAQPEEVTSDEHEAF